ncbi:hypothetical protein [Phocaeicola abscessus]|uniref:hypothetical protein n=1 Tax=Phocaeicola abscessus TaxID=555313 RepID=UPI0004B8C6FB|nr:hypothetical protein [Phocaeicola abscessus]
MKVKLTLAALALIAAGCSNQDLPEAVQDSQDSNARVITLQATMPQFTDDAATRATYEPDGASVSGVVMKWTADDKLKLCFKKGVAYYHKDATIVPGSISADGKTAKFTWEMPTEIGAGDTFDFYAVYQRPYMDETYGGVFEAGTANYKLVSEDYFGVTLDKGGERGNGIINPMLLFSRTGITKAGLNTLTLDLAHTGWIMALHLKNSTGMERQLPTYIRFQYPSESASSFIRNGLHGSQSLTMDVTTGEITTDYPRWRYKQCVSFSINDQSFLPLYGQKLAAGAELVLYRWLVSTDQVNQMGARMLQKDAGSYDYSTNNLPGRTVQKGKVYHTFLNWDGTNLKITNRAGTAY